MPRYDAPVRDMQFLLHDVLSIQNYSNLPGFDEATPDLVDAILEESGKFAKEVLFPLNQSGDQRRDHGRVKEHRLGARANDDALALLLVFVRGGRFGLVHAVSGSLLRSPNRRHRARAARACCGGWRAGGEW